MNFSLHLQFSPKTKQSNRKGKKNPYTYTVTVLDICLLCTWTHWLRICFGWKVYWKHSPCTYTYIHISRAVTLSHVANTLFLPFYMVVIILVWNMWSQFYPLLQPFHSLSAARFWLCLLDATHGGKNWCMDKARIRSASAVCIHTHEPLRQQWKVAVWLNPQSPDGQTEGW